ncbi:MAG TPA: aminoglycoside phosphotransferase family protein [Acidimicrobiales bacterium]|nr:aminoglycoside phosphotransferase family protein [Acidimicrobiales bacterium]
MKAKIDTSLVSRLVRDQFPHWAHQPVVAVPSAGTDHAIFRLGQDLAVRMPRLQRAADMASKEQQWLPRLAPLLPLAIPVPLGLGVPDDRFPYPWTVCRWLAGQDLVQRPVADLRDLALRLGRFIAALGHIDTAGAPVSVRAEPVSSHDDADVRSTIRSLANNGEVDANVANAVWDAALAAPARTEPPRWSHGDLLPANLLANHGRLTAVIDFGLMGLGDPAVDMLPAWALLTTQTRDLFRSEAGIDDATWVRGRGWALSAGLGAVRVYRTTNKALALAGWRAITETIADYRDKS